MTVCSSAKDKLIGKFVSDKRYGPAKVIAAEENKYRIEYFLSPWNRKSIVTSLGKAEPLRLYAQTRVYVESDGRWRMGRIDLAHQREDGGYDYDVQFPNKQVRRFPEKELFCRCWLAHDDPTATLASGGMETQYWHEHRQRFSATLLAQRSACRGLSAILSSRVELVPHQIEVVRRVLEDPLLRYLLADEVGMGKTIEAGLVIRQFLLSHTDGTVWVLVPGTLTRQWESELKQKFGIGEFPGRVRILSTKELDSLDEEVPAMLVVDEAHHLVAKDIPATLKQLSLAAPRLLLLSATPSLGHTDVLLRLLQLLDPDCYQNVDPESFAQRVEKREEFGVFLRGLRADANPAILRQRLRRLPELFSSDPEVLRLGETIAESLSANDTDAIRRGINSLRGHIADVHRIHQRLIRTRRRDAADWVFRPRGPAVTTEGDVDLSHVWMTWVDDSRYAPVFDLFEQWRVEMATRYQDRSQIRSDLAQWIVLLFEALGSGIEKFGDVLSGMPIQFLDIQWRDTFQTALEQTNEEAPRSAQIASVIQRHLEAFRQTHTDRMPRIVVFGSDTEDIKACATALISLIGKNKVLVAWEIGGDSDDAASYFEADINAQVMFCSPAEEEGLNLHFGDVIVHLDLPFSPARIEQRIGRLDRFGRKLNRLEQRIVFPSIEEDLSLWEAWFDVLAQAFHIFNAPVADVQFSLEAIADELADVLLEQGAAGLKQAISSVRQQLSQERERLDNQYSLDRVLQEEDAASGLFQALDDLEADEAEIARATTGWFVDSLLFTCKGDYLRIFRFLWDQDRTLLPVWPWAQLFQPGLDGSHTFLRSYALRDHGERMPQLLRIGSPLMRTIEREYRWDDRGTAFATWRQVPEMGDNEWLGFKLCYIVEARLPDGLDEGQKTSLRARLDNYFPPWFDVLYVDSELCAVDDPDRLALLMLPYDKSRDSNLGNRPESLEALIDPTQFERLCHGVRASSESWLREKAKFKETIVQAVERGSLDITRRIRRLEQRRANLAYAGESEDSGLTREIELNQLLLKVLANPIVKLDAIGTIVLSGRSPSAFMGEHL